MSTRTAESTVRLSYSAVNKNVLDDGETSATVTHADTVLSGKLDSGIAASESDRVWESKDRALSAGAFETLDLYDFTGLDIGGGSGKDGLGLDLVMDEVVGILIRVKSTSVGLLEIQPATVQGLAWIGTHNVANGGALPASGVLFKWNPAEAAFNNSADIANLKLTASGGAVTYTITVFGRHDDEESSSSSSLSSSTSSGSSASSVSSTSSLSSASSHSVTSSSSLSSTSSSSLSSSTLSSSSSSSASSSSSTSSPSSSSSLSSSSSS